MKAERIRILLAAALANAALAATLVVPASAQGDKPKVDPPGEVLEMSDHMTGSVGQTGEFPGKLICVRSKEALVPLTAEECGAKDRVYAIEMADDKAVRPVKAGNEEVERQMSDLLGKTVMVSGKFHSATGMVIASAVREKDPA